MTEASEDTAAQGETSGGSMASKQEPKLWSAILWSDETQSELFGYKDNVYIWRKKRDVYKPKDTVPQVKHGGGHIMLWNFVKIQGIMGKKEYFKIFDEDVKESTEKLQLGHNWKYQQKNNLKYTVQLVNKVLKDNNVNILEWPKICDET